jgi:hypothetical protein
MVEPAASRKVEGRDSSTTNRKGTASTAGTDPGSASTAGHTVDERRSLEVAKSGSSEPRSSAAGQPERNVSELRRPAMRLSRTGRPEEGPPIRPNNIASFDADAAAARRARLRFEASERETAPSAAEQVRSRMVTPSSRRHTASSETPASATGSDQPTSASRRGDVRNTGRLELADKMDIETLGESHNLVDSHAVGPLPSDASLFFPEPVVGPSDEFVPPSWFLEGIKKICANDSPTPTKSPIRFELSDQAAEHNATVLGRVGFDVGRLIRENSSSTLGFGSEFRRVSELEPLLGKHPHFAQLAQLLTEGMHYVFQRELNPSERRADVIYRVLCLVTCSRITTG